jgi:ADP-heptose:LPS heptosyltransferase
MRDVHHIAVFRALKLGDLLCATPALRALHAPRADGRRPHVTLVGLPWAAALARRLDCVDAFVPFPGHPQLPERSCSTERLARFLAAMRRRRFDLALQMHGSGTIVNPLVAAFGARWSFGFRPDADDGSPTATALDDSVPWPGHGSEIERCLALTDAVGLPRQGMRPDFPLQEADRRAASALLETHGVGRDHVIVHAGSQWPSRRWPPERFAAVADAMAGQGVQPVLTGSAGEAQLASQVRAAARHTVIDLCGRTDLFTLGALVESARLVVCNDTGISHVAAALRTPSVVVSCGSEVSRWAPLDHRLHPVRWIATPCRPCGHTVCPTRHECATGIEAPTVIQTALELLQATQPKTNSPCLTPAIPHMPRLSPPSPGGAFASSPGMSTATTFTT